MRGARAYAAVGVQSGVMSASPHQLIVMLLDGALASMRAARLHMQGGSIEEKGRAFSRAVDIVSNGLIAALDYERGGELAAQLGQIYDYVVRLLLQANLHNDEQRLDEAMALLAEIDSAWREIAPEVHGR
jgi:flagellar protein FliS